MDFPLFHLDWLNDRFLIAFIAILHVWINHGLAVGFMPYITWLEYKGVKNAPSNQITDPEWDEVVYNKMKVAFIITTTLGAMTGVGIWFSAALVSPNSIASLLRVFYFAWFVEWIVFVTEIVLILIYFLTWRNANKSLRSKLKHIRFGVFLSVFSWITMCVIVAILGFMMDPGNWLTDQSLFNGFTNPIYLPQLLFRTPTAMVVAGIFGLMLTTLFAAKKTKTKNKMLHYGGIWVLLWTPLSILGAVIYYKVMPSAMIANMSTAVGTMAFEQYYNILKYIIVVSAFVALLFALWAIIKPKSFKFAATILPFIIILGFLGIFERVREFVRKPYIIGNYMYSNLIREDYYPLLQKEGVLKNATYTSVNEITEENKIQAGREVFVITCSRCHTTQGINSITNVFERMYGKGKPLDVEAMKAYMPGMHKVRTYMPPFPGNKEEMDALACYIKYLQQTGESLEGAQTRGIDINPDHTTEAILPLMN